MYADEVKTNDGGDNNYNQHSIHDRHSSLLDVFDSNSCEKKGCMDNSEESDHHWVYSIRDDRNQIDIHSQGNHIHTNQESAQNHSDNTLVLRQKDEYAEYNIL